MEKAVAQSTAHSSSSRSRLASSLVFLQHIFFKTEALMAGCSVTSPGSGNCGGREAPLPCPRNRLTRRHPHPSKNPRHSRPRPSSLSIPLVVPFSHNDLVHDISHVAVAYPVVRFAVQQGIAPGRIIVRSPRWAARFWEWW